MIITVEMKKRIAAALNIDEDTAHVAIDLVASEIDRTQILPLWVSNLPYQQQTVLLLALRGPDGLRKHHPMKVIQRAYRASVIKAAYFGRMMTAHDPDDSFMSYKVMFKVLSDSEPNLGIFKDYFDAIDELPHHFHNHLMHGAQILGYKHPHDGVRKFWNAFYLSCADDAHLEPETEATMDKRLCDWGRTSWDRGNGK